MSIAYSCTLAIVGAGIAGLMAAAAAREAGIEALVVEKGAALAAAWRHAGSATLSSTTARNFSLSVIFSSRRMSKVGNAAALRPSGATDSGSGMGTPPLHRRERNDHGTQSLGRKRVHPARDEGTACTYNHGWTLHLQNGASIEAQALLLTAPVPQSLALLEAGGVSLPVGPREALQSLTYAPSMALMAHLDRQTSIPSPGAVRLNEQSAIWIADNHRKGISPEPGSAIIQCSASFAQENWEAPQEAIMRRMLQPVRRFCRGEIVDWQLHRWRYAEPLHPYPDRCLAMNEPGLAVFAGDAFGGPRVEGAALSGLAAIEEILQRLHS